MDDDAWKQVERTLAAQDGAIVAGQIPPSCEWRARWAVDSGRWQRFHDGIFVNHSGTVTLEQRIWAAILAGGEGAAACGPTAAALGGLVGFERETIHVLIPWNRSGPDITGVKYHRSRRDYEAEIAKNREPRRVILAYALISMAAKAAGDSTAYRILTSAAQQRLIRTRDIREVVMTRPKLARRRLILETLLDIDDGAQSLNELAMQRLVRRSRLPRPKLQLVAATRRRRSRLDGGWPEFGVYFEIDGAGHFEVTKWYDDADRQNEVALSVEPGSTLLRWPGFVVRHQPDRVVDQARRALERGGWQPRR